ncbi:efflux transporter outer membrane subunit [Uliginosibacterium gangwonense]|uniref:efflux transporter outer membrane subunit n=1 Tax=Uliginosibacterium gangwonense TaxID=392736 RepID=UPI00037F3CBD|nr:efflux transporter outer membrane subunit [Uliginosibacterium gangwonense]
MILASLHEGWHGTWSYHAILALLILLQLGGCSLAPVYENPHFKVPQTLGGANLTVDTRSDTTNVALSLEEQRFLGDFSPRFDLVPLVTQALVHNPDFRITVLQVQQARAYYQIEHSRQLPTLSANAQGVRQSYSAVDMQERYGQKLATVGIGINDFELDFFGRMASLSIAAQQRYLATRYGQQAARGALIAELLRAYTLERATFQAQAYYSAIMEDCAALMAFASSQHGVGLISDDELSRQRRQADQAQVRAMQAISDHDAARRALQLIAGFEAPIGYGTLEELQPSDHNDWGLRDLESTVLLQRPDVQQAEAELRARNADIGAARAAFFPTIRLSTSFGGASDSLQGLFESASRTWTFMPQLTMPIFDFGRNRANLDVAYLRKQAGIADYEKAIESAFREVADAIGVRPSLQQQDQREQTNLGRERLRIERMDKRVALGLQDRTALLVERISVEQMELEYLQARQALLLNRIALFRAFYGVHLSHAS